MESALGRGDDGDKPAVGSGATRTKASPYATPILPPRSFNAKPTPRRGEHGQYRASSTLLETPSGEEVLAFTPPHSIESAHEPVVARRQNSPQDEDESSMQRSASEWWQDRSAGEGLSPPVEAASEPTDALEKHMDEALVIETQRASPSRGRPEKGNQVVDTQSLPTVTRIDQLASIMVSTGKTFVEWPSLLVVKTEGFTEERHAPWFLPATLVANVALFVGVCCANDCPGQEGEGGLARRCVGASVLHQCSFEPRDINPLLGPRKETLLRLGAKSSWEIVEDAEVWRLLTSMYLHSGLLHVAANMLGLMGYGWRLERDFGALKVAAVWLISGTFAMMSSAAILPKEITVGASGATCGLLGSSLAELILNWGHYHLQLRIGLVLLLGIGLNVIVGLSPFVDNVCHLAGLCMGFLLGFTLFTRRRFREDLMACGPREGQSSVILEPKKGWQWVLIFGSIPTIVGLYLAAMGLLFTRVEMSALCPNCYAINCVNTLFWFACTAVPFASCSSLFKA